MTWLRDSLALAGCGAITFGLWQAWPPLAWMFGGAVLLGTAIMAALKVQINGRT